MAATVDANRVAEFFDSPEDLDEKVRALATLVRDSNYIVFFTGAGVSTSAGIGDYRGPSGTWTKRRIHQLRGKGAEASTEEADELRRLETEQAREVPKSAAPRVIPKELLGPGFSHKAIATMIHGRFAHYCVTTNLDALFRKAGLEGHRQLCCLHGDIFVERCTGCGAEFERNFRVRQAERHKHDHHTHAAPCPRCRSVVPPEWTGRPQGPLIVKRVKVKTKPSSDATTIKIITNNARRKWPDAVLVSVNGDVVEGQTDQILRRVVAEAPLPLIFEFRVPSSSAPETGGDTGFENNHLVGVQAKGVGLKDTHINFGESLDATDWDEACAHCSKADLCIVLGTSMSLPHCTHFPFMARRTVLVNLQHTPYDHRFDWQTRIWGSCDQVLRLLLQHLGDVKIKEPLAWRPRDAVSLEELERWGLSRKDQAVARHIEEAARKVEATLG